MQRYEILMVGLLMLSMALSACGGSDNSSSAANAASDSSGAADTGAASASGEATATPVTEITASTLTLTGQVTLIGADGSEILTDLDEQLPATALYTYEGGYTNSDPWYTVTIQPENEWLDNGLRFTQLEILFHPNELAIGDHNIGDVSSDYLSIDIWGDFAPADGDSLTGTITLNETGDIFSGSADLTTQFEGGEYDDFASGTIRIAVDFDGIALDNPDALAADVALVEAEQNAEATRNESVQLTITGAVGLVLPPAEIHYAENSWINTYELFMDAPDGFRFELLFLNSLEPGAYIPEGCRGGQREGDLCFALKMPDGQRFNQVQSGSVTLESITPLNAQIDVTLADADGNTVQITGSAANTEAGQ
jgi:hypothetical protein